MNLAKQNLHGSKNQWHTFAKISLLRICFVCTVHLDTISLFTHHRMHDCLKNNIKIYIKIADMFWCSHTIFRERIIHAC